MEKQMIVTIPYETPSKKNSRIVDRRTGRTFPSKTYREWHGKASRWLKTHYILPSLGEGPFRLSCVFIHGTMARCDSDNKVSSILDLLTDLVVIPDDRWQVVREIFVSNFYEKGNPSCVVKLFPLSECYGEGV